MLDWAVEGRRARGEHWVAGGWRGRNEVWREYDAAEATVGSTGTETDSPASNRENKRVLMLRDAVILSGGPNGPGQASLRHEGVGVFGTVILAGPVFKEMGDFFVEEFAALPRIGARDWGDEVQEDERLDGDVVKDARKRRVAWRRRRVQLEKEEGVLWTTARVRGAVLVKFGAREVQGARTWLREMWGYEGTVEREFGEGGMMSLR